MTPRDMLRRLFDAAIAAADPASCVPPHLPPDDGGRLIVVGAGKASAAMARAVERHWDGPVEGLVVTRYGYAVPTERIEIVEAAHPVPDAAGQRAAVFGVEQCSLHGNGHPANVSHNSSNVCQRRGRGAHTAGAAIRWQL